MATAVEFDFETKTERPIPPEAMRSVIENRRCCWIDLDVTDRAAAERVLRDLGMENAVVEESLNASVSGRLDAYEECLHVTVSAVTFKDGELATSQVDIILGDNFIVTMHRGRVDFLEQVRRAYSKDFVKFAKSLSFLLYEVWDHLIDSYVKALHAISDEFESLQHEIFADADDAMFGQVAKLTRKLLMFRKITMTAREVLRELATRRSSFVSETAQPYLDNMVGTLERLGSDLAVERETLAETLNLYLGIVSHRTNKIVNRLTILSMIFLPLTFLCGVYGMNFEHLPEFKWPLGYVYFWGLAATISGGLLVAMKKNRWI